MNKSNNIEKPKDSKVQQKPNAAASTDIMDLQEAPKMMKPGEQTKAFVQTKSGGKVNRFQEWTGTEADEDTESSPASAIG